MLFRIIPVVPLALLAACGGGGGGGATERHYLLVEVDGETIDYEERAPFELEGEQYRFAQTWLVVQPEGASEPSELYTYAEYRRGEGDSCVHGFDEFPLETVQAESTDTSWLSVLTFEDAGTYNCVFNSSNLYCSAGTRTLEFRGEGYSADADKLRGIDPCAWTSES